MNVMSCRRRDHISAAAFEQHRANIVDVLLIGFAGAIQPGELNATDDHRHLILIKNDRPWPVEKITQFHKADHARPDIGFNRRRAGEYHQRDEILIGEVKQVSDRLEMAEVLPDRILKSPAGAVENLRPLRIAGSAEDQTAVMFGFYDEYTGIGDDDMVNLGGAGARRHGDMVHDLVGAMEMSLDSGGNRTVPLTESGGPPGSDGQADQNREKECGNQIRSDHSQIPYR